MSSSNQKRKYPDYISVGVSTNGNAYIYPDYVKCGLYLKQYIEENDTQSIQIMASHNVDFNEKKLGFNPLKIATEKGHIESLRALLMHNADPAKEFSDQAPRKCPFVFAACLGKPEMIDEMMDHGILTKEIKVAMLRVAIQESRHNVIIFMVEKDLFEEFEKHDAALVQLATHPVFHFPGKTRQLVQALYYKKDFDLADFNIFPPEKAEDIQKKIQSLKDAHKQSLQRVKKQVAGKSPLRRRPKF